MFLSEEEQLFYLCNRYWIMFHLFSCLEQRKEYEKKIEKKVVENGLFLDWHQIKRIGEARNSRKSKNRPFLTIN